MGFHGIQDTESQGKQFEQWSNDPNKTYAYQGAQLDAAACSQIEAAVRGGGLHRAQPLKQAHVGAGAGDAAHTGHSHACFASQKGQLWDAYAEAVDAKKAAMAPGQALTRPIDISQRDVGSKTFGCACGGKANQYSLVVKTSGAQAVGWNNASEPTVSSRRGGIVGMPPRK